MWKQKWLNWMQNCHFFMANEVNLPSIDDPSQSNPHFSNVHPFLFGQIPNSILKLPISWWISVKSPMFLLPPCFFFILVAKSPKFGASNGPNIRWTLGMDLFFGRKMGRKFARNMAGWGRVAAEKSLVFLRCQACERLGAGLWEQPGLLGEIGGLNQWKWWV